HQRNLRRKLEPFERLGKLYTLEGLLLIGDESAGPAGDEAEPVTRRRHLAAGLALDGVDEFRDMRHAGLLPVPLEDPGADARLGRQSLEHLELLLRTGNMEALVQAELDGLLQRVDGVLAGIEEDDDVGIGRLRLDQVGGEVGGGERRKRDAGLGAAELL